MVCQNLFAYFSMYCLQNHCRDGELSADTIEFAQSTLQYYYQAYRPIDYYDHDNYDTVLSSSPVGLMNGKFQIKVFREDMIKSTVTACRLQRPIAHELEASYYNWYQCPACGCNTEIFESYYDHILEKKAR